MTTLTAEQHHLIKVIVTVLAIVCAAIAVILFFGVYDDKGANVADGLGWLGLAVGGGLVASLV